MKNCPVCKDELDDGYCQTCQEELEDLVLIQHEKLLDELWKVVNDSNFSPAARVNIIARKIREFSKS